MNGGTCTEPTPCGFVCSCLQFPIAYSGAFCQNQIVLAAQSGVSWIYSTNETRYFTVQQQDTLQFSAVATNIYAAYQQANINNICPFGFTPISHSCYYLNQQFVYSWSQAESNCQALGADLAWFDDLTQLDQVRAWLQTITLVNLRNIWIGGRYDVNRWLWAYNNTPITSDILSSRWAPNNPTFNQTFQNGLLMSPINSFYLVNDASTKNQFSLLCKRKAFLFNSATTSLTPVKQITAIDSSGNDITGFVYEVQVAQVSGLLNVVQPNINVYASVFQANPVAGATFFTGQAYEYTQPFSLSLCNDLTGGQISNVQQLVYNYWRQIRPEFTQCNCFDIYFVNVVNYISSSNSQATQISYVGLANFLIIESTSSGPLPNNTALYGILLANGYSQCQSRRLRSLLVPVSTTQAVDKSTITPIIESSVCSSRPDLCNSVINVTVDASVNGIDVSKMLPVTTYYVNITVNGAQLTPSGFDMQVLTNSLNYNNRANNIDPFSFVMSSQVYSTNYFFTVYSTAQVPVAHYVNLSNIIQCIFIAHYTQFNSSMVNVSIVLQQAYIDTTGMVLYGCNVLLSIDKKPADDVIYYDRSIFNSIQSYASQYAVAASFFVPVGNVYLLGASLDFYTDYMITDYVKAKFTALVTNALMSLCECYFHYFFVCCCLIKFFLLSI